MAAPIICVGGSRKLVLTPGVLVGELSPTAWSQASTGPQQNGYSPLHQGTRHIVASSGELPPSLHAAAQGQESPLSPLFAAAALSAPVPAGVAAGAAASLPDGSLQPLSQRWRGCPAEGWLAQALQVNESCCLAQTLHLTAAGSFQRPCSLRLGAVCLHAILPTRPLLLTASCHLQCLYHCCFPGPMLSSLSSAAHEDPTPTHLVQCCPGPSCIQTKVTCLVH